MAKNANSKTFVLPVQWNGRRYSESGDVPAVTAPSGLSATPSGTTMALAWTNGEATATTVIERSPNGSSGWLPIVTKDAGVTSHNDTGLANAAYYYRIRHLINSTYSSYSSSANGTISGGTAGFAHGSSYTFTGTGFGTKSEPLPIVFDDFSQGTLNARIRPNAPLFSSNSTLWDDQGLTATRPVYTNEQLRTGHTRSAKVDYSTTYANALELIDTTFTEPGAEKFVSWWMYYNKTSSAYCRNYKPIMFPGTFENQMPEFYLGWGAPSSDDQLRNSFQDKASGASAAGVINTPTIFTSPNIDDVIGQWIKFEVWFKQSTADTYDGAFEVRYHNNSTAVSRIMQDLSVRTRLYADRYNRNLLLGGYHSLDGGATGVVYISDVYVDSTRQRVELGNASTWSACTRTETQVATAWSDTSITIRANTGAFTAGQTAYLYVIDANGDPVSTNGTAVTVA